MRDHDEAEMKKMFDVAEACANATLLTIQTENLCVPCTASLIAAIILKITATSCDIDEAEMMNEIWDQLQNHLNIEEGYLQ
jgi:hypothetical protein